MVSESPPGSGVWRELQEAGAASQAAAGGCDPVRGSGETLRGSMLAASPISSLPSCCWAVGRTGKRRRERVAGWRGRHIPDYIFSSSSLSVSLPKALLPDRLPCHQPTAPEEASASRGLSCTGNRGLWEAARRNRGSDPVRPGPQLVVALWGQDLESPVLVPPLHCLPGRLCHAHLV